MLLHRSNDRNISRRDASRNNDRNISPVSTAPPAPYTHGYRPGATPYRLLSTPLYFPFLICRSPSGGRRAQRAEAFKAAARAGKQTLNSDGCHPSEFLGLPALAQPPGRPRPPKAARPRPAQENTSPAPEDGFRGKVLKIALCSGACGAAIFNTTRHFGWSGLERTGAALSGLGRP